MSCVMPRSWKPHDTCKWGEPKWQGILPFVLSFTNFCWHVTYKINRPIHGYRRHFVKGAKPLGRARGQTNGDAFTMPKHARCCVGFCDNDERFPNLLVVRSHVKELKFHRWPKDPNLAELWRKQVAKGLQSRTWIGGHICLFKSLSWGHENSPQSKYWLSFGFLNIKRLSLTNSHV